MTFAPSVMPAGGRPPDLLVDTSVAVALLVEDHRHHDSVSEALGRRRLGLSGHAAFETYSVLTRLPSSSRLTPRVAEEAIAGVFPHTRMLGADAAERVRAALPSLGIAGGAVYDALVAAAAREHGLVLASRDVRAIEVYRAVGADVEII